MSLHATDFSLSLFIRTLKNMHSWIEKAESYAAEKKFDPAVLLSARLAPDMFPFEQQVRSTIGHARRAMVGLLGEEPLPLQGDAPAASVGELKARLQSAIELLKAKDAASIEKGLENPIELAFLPEKPKFPAGILLHRLWLPNFFFHASMAYAILRHNGVPVGKLDYIGPVSF